MPAEVETMAYAVQKPWHGLGFEVSADLTPKEMLKAAQIDWTVSKRPVYTTNVNPAKGNQVIEASLQIKDFFALVRDSDNRILGPCGKDYVPTQNVEAFEFFKRFTESGHMKMETAGSLHGGKQVWGLARIEKKFELPGGDEVGGFVLLASPHIWGKSLTIKFTTIRVVCSNTFTMALREKGQKAFRAAHVRPFDDTVRKEAEQVLGISETLMGGFEKVARKLAKTKIDQAAVIRYIADVYDPGLIKDALGKGFYNLAPTKQAELLIDPTSTEIDPMDLSRSAGDTLSCVNSQPGADLKSSAGTLWGAFNAVTYHVDHMAGRDRNNALYAAWFGTRVPIKNKAYERAAQIAEVVVK